MEGKNNVVIILLVALIGVVAGVGLLIGINNAVGVAVNPLNAKLAALEKTEKSIENKLDAQNVLLTQIQNKLNTLNAPAQPPQPPPEDLNKVYTIDIGTSPVIGKKDAPVTIVEFSDFQCPFCSRFYQPIKDVLAAYPDQVNVVVKNYPLPFHPNARPAAKLALAANEQGKYREMMEALLVNNADISEAKIKEYAKSTGIDYDKLMADYKSKDAQWEKQIQDDMKMAEEIDVRGTPTFFLNGRKTNARDINAFKAQIDPLLAEKK